MSFPITASAVFQAALDLQRFCEEAGWSFCFIGGIALERWGVPRFTRDADMTIITRFDRDEECITRLLARFTPRRPDAAEFAARFRVLLLQHENGIGLDVALGALDFEVRCMERSSLWRARPGVELRICSAEDLIVHKAFASRLQDWADVENILAVQRKGLNVAQILAELAPLAELKEDPSIVPRVKKMLQTHGLLPDGPEA